MTWQVALVVVATLVAVTVIVTRFLRYLERTAPSEETLAAERLLEANVSPALLAKAFGRESRTGPDLVADEDLDEQEPPEFDHTEPVPVDPDNPPTIKVYSPRPGAEIRTCHCHNEPIEPGTAIIWWPQPDGSVRLYHREAVDVPQQ